MRTQILLGVALTGALVALACGNESNGDDDQNPGGSAGVGGGSSGSATSGSSGSSGTSAGRGGTGSGGTGTSGGGAGGSPSGGSGGSRAGSDSAGGSSGDATSGTGGDESTGGSSVGGSSGGTNAGGSGDAASGGSSGTNAGGSGGGLPNAVPSEGCSLDAPSTLDGEQTFDVEGDEREFIIRLPEGYDGKTPNRIIFAFHGASGSADQVDKGDPPNSGLEPTGPYYGIKEHADDRTIFVAGQAAGTWNVDDIAYTETLVAKLKAELCLDESRILATGFSMGGIMTLRMACNLPDIFRAVAPMSCSLSAANCMADGDPVAYWSSHGEQDTTIDISNGEAARDEFAERNGCDTGADPLPIGSDGCVAYQDCDDGYPVQWCPFMGIHEPPPFSGPEIWAFLSQF